MTCQFSANLRKESVNKGKKKGQIFNKGVGKCRKRRKFF